MSNVAGRVVRLRRLMSNVASRVVRLWRPAEILVGALFIAGAMLKAGDVNQFVIQISFYGVLHTQPSFVVAALCTLWLETALGFALVLGARLRGATLAATIALLLVFSGLIGYGWAFHGLKNCGCFGRAEMSPQVSIAKNVVLLGLCLFALFGYLRSRRPVFDLRLVLFLYAIPALLACGVTAHAYAHVEAAPKKDTLFSQFVFEADGQKYDLGNGEYFVASYSMTCEHCMTSVEKVNELVAAPGFPPTVALCYEEKPGDLDTFRATTAPGFPLHSYGASVRTFLSLKGEEPPRFYVLRDGQPLKYWDEKIPSAEEVLAALAGNG